MLEDPAAAVPPEPIAEAPAPVSEAVARFRSCRWRALAEDGTSDHCTHRDVLPFAGREGFNAEAWCPGCGYYKVRRTPKKRDPSEYRY